MDEERKTREELIGENTVLHPRMPDLLPQCSEEENRALIEALSDLIFRVDRNGIIKGYHASNLSELYVPPDVFLDRKMQEVLPVQLVDKAMEIMNRVFETGKPGLLEYELEIGGERKFYDDRITLLNDEEVLHVIRDITGRKRREEQLRRINEQLLKLDEDDYAGNLDSLTQLCGELLGADCALYNRLDGDLLCVAGQWQSPPVMKREDAPEGHICFDVISRRSDRPLIVRHLQESVYAKTDPNVSAYGLRTYVGCRVRFGGKARGSLCVVYTSDYEPSDNDLDIISIIAAAIAQEEERAAAVQRLRQNETFVSSILNTVDEGIIVVDRDYRILSANRAYCGHVGLACEEVLLKRCFEVCHKADRPCHEGGEDCAVKRAFETGMSHTSCHSHSDSQGNLLHVEAKAFPLKDETGAVISVIESITDITESHLLQEERLKTQKLEAIGTLAGGIAHDFNNLLQGVFGFISLAKLTAGENEKSIAAIEEAEKALHRTVRLTNQLLTFSKGGTPVKRPIDLLPVIEDAAKFALSGSRSGYRIIAGEGLWEAEADEGQIGQVIQNIVLNADQSMPEGGEVEITMSNVLAPGRGVPQGLGEGRYLEIAVRDSGIGIPEQYVAKIFDPYFTTKEKGSGLGLATSYSIIRNHGGMIDVKSETGKGSTFSIYIPAVEAGQKAESRQPAVAAVPARSGRILVMDDEPLVLDVATKLIRALGHEVECAVHGEEAIEKYLAAKQSEKPFDLLILDLTVRGGPGGADTMRRLLEIDPGVKAAVSSGYSDDTAMADYLQQGFKVFLKKPYDITELRNVLNTFLQ